MPDWESEARGVPLPAHILGHQTAASYAILSDCSQKRDDTGVAVHATVLRDREACYRPMRMHVSPLQMTNPSESRARSPRS